MATIESEKKTESTKTKKKQKNLVLIRHAQSTENVKVIRFFEGLARIRNFQLPTCDQLRGALSLLSLTIDSAVSQQGKRQILDMHMILRDDKFWSRQSFDLIVCSPLIRARETCKGVLPTDSRETDFMILDDLEEATPYEHVFGATLLTRIERFKVWLDSREEENILVVGHSQYFKKMLGSTTLMRNCDVWQCNFTSDVKFLNSSSNPTSTYEWSDINLLHRTELSDIHPYDKMINSNRGGSTPVDQRAGEDVFNDLHPEEPSCRICQVSILTKFTSCFNFLDLPLHMN